MKQSKCSNCGFEDSIQRIKCDQDRFCSHKCLLEFAAKNDPSWKNSEYYRMVLEWHQESGATDTATPGSNASSEPSVE